jgi:hypothetical protein
VGEEAVRVLAGQDHGTDPVVLLGTRDQIVQGVDEGLVEERVRRVRERREKDTPVLIDLDRPAHRASRLIMKPTIRATAIRIAVATSPARSSVSSITAPLLPADMTEPNEAADIAEPNDAAEATENADAADPMDPIERTEPMDPIERYDPFEAIERNESSDQRLSDSESTPAVSHAHRTCGTNFQRALYTGPIGTFRRQGWLVTS